MQLRARDLFIILLCCFALNVAISHAQFNGGGSGVCISGTPSANQMAIWANSSCVTNGASIVGTLMQSAPITSGTATSNVFNYDFTTAFGALNGLTSTVKTFTITGLLTTDAVTLSCISSLSAGASIANVRVSAANTLEVTFTTVLSLGLTLPSLNYRLTVTRA